MNAVLAKFKAEYPKNRYIIEKLMKDFGLDRFEVIEQIGYKEFNKFERYYTPRKQTYNSKYGETDKLKLVDLYNKGMDYQEMAAKTGINLKSFSSMLSRMKQSGKYNFDTRPFVERHAAYIAKNDG